MCSQPARLNSSGRAEMPPTSRWAWSILSGVITGSGKIAFQIVLQPEEDDVVPLVRRGSRSRNRPAPFPADIASNG